MNHDDGSLIIIFVFVSLFSRENKPVDKQLLGAGEYFIHRIAPTYLQPTTSNKVIFNRRDRVFYHGRMLQCRALICIGEGEEEVNTFPWFTELISLRNAASFNMKTALRSIKVTIHYYYYY